MWLKQSSLPADFCRWKNIIPSKSRFRREVWHLPRLYRPLVLKGGDSQIPTWGHTYFSGCSVGISWGCHGYGNVQPTLIGRYGYMNGSLGTIIIYLDTGAKLSSRDPMSGMNDDGVSWWIQITIYWSILGNSEIFKAHQAHLKIGWKERIEF